MFDQCSEYLRVPTNIPNNDRMEIHDNIQRAAECIKMSDVGQQKNQQKVSVRIYYCLRNVLPMYRMYVTFQAIINS